MQNLVTSFNINNNDTWAILYDYSESLDFSNYTYRIGNDGKLETIYSPSTMTSKALQYTTESRKNWWTNMIDFPISATLTIKGLIRPAILMSYVKINVWFYGALHDSSGLYFITKQQDRIDSQGYRTILSLTRIPDSRKAYDSAYQKQYTSSGGATFTGGGRSFQDSSTTSNGATISGSKEKVSSANNQYSSYGGNNGSGQGRQF